MNRRGFRSERITFAYPTPVLNWSIPSRISTKTAGWKTTPSSPGRRWRGCCAVSSRIETFSLETDWTLCTTVWSWSLLWSAIRAFRKVMRTTWDLDSTTFCQDSTPTRAFWRDGLSLFPSLFSASFLFPICIRGSISWFFVCVLFTKDVCSPPNVLNNRCWKPNAHFADPFPVLFIGGL